MDHLICMLTPLSRCITALCFLFLVIAFLLAEHGRRTGIGATLLRKLAPVTALLARQGASGGQSTRRGLSIQVTDRAVAHRALVKHGAAFLDRPTGAVPSTILTRNRHYNILSAPYGPYWRAVRRNVAAGVLHPSRLRLLGDTRARVLGDLVRALGSGAPAGESLHFAVYSILAEMCFGKDVVSKLGETRLRAMQKFQRDILLALPSFGVFVRYPWTGKILYPSRWRRLLALRRQQEESFLPLIAEVKNNRNDDHRDDATFKTYVESLLDLRIHDDGGRAVTDGELVSLISEFLGAGTDSTAAALEWTMANLVKRPDLQRKLRVEADAVACRSKRVIEEAELSRMPYLKAVVLESLRRHPPVPFVLRHVQGDEAAKALGLPSLAGGGELPRGEDRPRPRGVVGPDGVRARAVHARRGWRGRGPDLHEGAQDDALRRREVRVPGARAGVAAPGVPRCQPGQGVRVAGGGRRRRGRPRRVPRLLLHRNEPPASRAPRATRRPRIGHQSKVVN